MPPTIYVLPEYFRILYYVSSFLQQQSSTHSQNTNHSRRINLGRNTGKRARWSNISTSSSRFSSRSIRLCSLLQAAGGGSPGSGIIAITTTAGVGLAAVWCIGRDVLWCGGGSSFVVLEGACSILGGAWLMLVSECFNREERRGRLTSR